jgi:hypothetical protein
MEGANESARVAVNAVLAAEKSDAKPCALFDPADNHPAWLEVFQEMDARRYRRGLPWGGIDLSAALVTSARALDVIGDEALLNDVATVSRGPVPPGEPLRLPREQYDPEVQKAIDLLGSQQLVVQRAASLARPITDSEAEEWLQADRPSAGRRDPMFKRWRLHALTHEKVQYLIPFHVYEGDSLVIHGQAALDELEALTAGTGYHPVVGVDGEGKKHGFAELWVVDYRDTSAGAYKELVINFVVTTRKGHKPYRYESPYSSIVPMMDSQNRLFTPLLLVDQEEDEDLKRHKGAIRYGNKLFGTNKQNAQITIERDRATGKKTFSWKGKVDASDEGSGNVREIESVLQDASDSIQLARVMGLSEVVRNARQAMNGEELLGGLVTRDHREGRNRALTVDIRASYKFAPRIRVLGASEGILAKPPVDGPRSENSLSQLLARIGFKPRIATYDHHLKSVLYLAGWPNPDGRPVPDLPKLQKREDEIAQAHYHTPDHPRRSEPPEALIAQSGRSSSETIS